MRGEGDAAAARRGARTFSSSSKCARSLWRYTWRGALELRMPLIMLAWLLASLSTMRFGKILGSSPSTLSLAT